MDVRDDNSEEERLLVGKREVDQRVYWERKRVKEKTYEDKWGKWEMRGKIVKQLMTFSSLYMPWVFH